MLQLADELTLTLMQKIRKASKDAIEAAGGTFPDDPSYAVIDKMVDLGRPSKAAGAGFYEYEDGKRTRLWPGLAETFGSQSVPSTTDPASISLVDLQERMLFREAIETVKCLDEGVLETVSDANIGSIFGIGFPAWTGGVLQYINGYVDPRDPEKKTLGPAGFVARARELAEQYGERFEPPASLVAKAEAGEIYADEVPAAA